MTRSTLIPSDQVTAHIKKLDEKIADVIEYLRRLILSADKEMRPD